MPVQPIVRCPKQSRPSVHQLARFVLALVPLIALLIRPALRVQAQEARCFPEQAAVTACISGQFRAFWEAHGGLPVFGYPLTDAAMQQTDDGTFLTQYFERARFELHPENAPPYNVLLGRLGAEQLTARSSSLPIASNPQDGDCQTWRETSQTVCGSFLTTWRGNGLQLDDDPSLNDAERLALWGLPLTGILNIITENGALRTQYFERARFEQQADGTVTIGRLGSELLDQPAQEPSEPTPSAAPEPTPVPVVEPTPVPAAPEPPVAAPVPSVPFPSVPCNVNVPTPANGLQVWMPDQNPSREGDAVVCVRLILDGEAANGANAIIYRYIGNERRPSIPQSTGLDGVASFIFYIRDLPAGADIPVEAIVAYRGTTYVAYTAFTPQ